MKKFRILGSVAAASALLAACGGGGDGDQSPRIAYAKMVSFGDSLSDVGTYAAVGGVAAGLYHSAGHYSINGVGFDGLPYTNWTEFLSAQLGLAAPCPAEQGLATSTTPVDHGDGNPPYPVFGPTFGPVAPVDTATCYNYAQGGARVTAQPGPGNVALFNPAVSSTWGNALGQLTKPVKDQIAAHLAAHGGAFESTDLVTVLAGGNDLLIQLLTLPQAVAAYMGTGLDQATATAKAAADAVAASARAGAELADDVDTLILAKGATHVVLVNLPDLAKTPFAYALDASTQTLIETMVTAFNARLAAGVDANSASLLVVDAQTSQQQEADDPAQYGLTNVTVPACDLTKVGSSLFCTAATVIPGDVSHYEFADTVHPTPYGYRLLAQLVAQRMAIKGWL